MENRLKIVLVEGGNTATDLLQNVLQELGLAHEIVAVLENLAGARTFFHRTQAFDLVVMAVELPDGSCFELLATTSINRPIIFCASDPQHAFAALHYPCIHYLLYPLSTEKLREALRKYLFFKQLKEPAATKQGIGSAPTTANAGYKQRFLVREDQKMILLGIAAIVCIYSEKGRTFLVPSSGKTYAVDYPLERLEALLDPTEFFRINRKVLLHLPAIASVEDYFNNRLRVKLSAKSPVDLVVSRKRVKAFKNWLRGGV